MLMQRHVVRTIKGHPGWKLFYQL